MKEQSIDTNVKKLFGDFVADWDHLPDVLSKPAVPCERIVVVVTEIDERSAFSRPLAEYVSQHFPPSWQLESIIPVPLLSCSSDVDLNEAVTSVISTFVVGARLRIVMAGGTAEFGIVGSKRRMACGSSGPVVSTAVSASLVLPFNDSWIDKYVCDRCSLDIENERLVFDHSFFSIRRDQSRVRPKA